MYVDGQRVAVTAMVVPESEQRKSEEQIGFALSVRQFFHNDPVGSTAMLTNQSGERTQELDYFPFGEELFDKRAVNDENLPQEYRFDGKELDSETALQYFGARYYDPRIGRWISADPLYRTTPDIGLREPRQLNLYAFGSNSPLLNHDPDGREEIGLLRADPYALARLHERFQVYEDPSSFNVYYVPPDPNFKLLGPSAFHIPMAQLWEYLWSLPGFDPGVDPMRMSPGGAILAELYVDVVASSIVPAAELSWSLKLRYGGSAAYRRAVAGAVREQAVIEQFFSGSDIIQGLKLGEGGQIRGEIDILDLTRNLAAEVGGFSKGKFLQDFTKQLERLKTFAQERGFTPKVFLEKGTPQDAIDQAVKILGKENVTSFTP